MSGAFRKYFFMDGGRDLLSPSGRRVHNKDTAQRDVLFFGQREAVMFDKRIDRVGPVLFPGKSPETKE